MKRLASLCLAIIVPGGISAARAADMPVLFEHVRVIDGTGSAARDNMNVLVRDGRIASVTSGTQPADEAGVHVINLAGYTMIPGLISDHSHVGLVGGTSDSGANFTRDNILHALRQYEVYGVTTVTALGVTKSPLFDDLRREQHAGANAGADLFGVDQGIGVPGGAPPEGMMHVGSDQLMRPSTPEEARQDVDKMAAEGTDLVKLWVDDFRNGVASKAPMPMMTPEVWHAVITHAHELKLRVAAHIHDLKYARMMVEGQADILAHGVRDQPIDHALIARMKQAGTWYIPTISLDEASYLFAEQPQLLADPELTQGLDPALRAQISDPAWRAKTLAAPLTPASHKAVAMNEKNLMLLYRAGVKIGFGTDSGATALRIPGFAEHRELRLMVEAGLTPMEAIRVATSQAAALLNLQDRGVIAPGKRADLVVLKADPSTDITAVDKIESVWRGGQRTGQP